MSYSNEPDFLETLDEAKKLELFLSWLQRSKDFFEPIWEEGGHMWDMYPGESFSEIDRQYLKDTKRPVLDPPFAGGVIDTIVGAELAQQVEPVFHGVDSEVEDEVIAGWYTSLVKHGWAKVDGHDQLMAAYQDMLVTGYGFACQYLDLSKVPHRPTIKAVDFYQVWPDPDATEQNLADADYFCIETEWRRSDAQARWPDKKAELDLAANREALPDATPRAIRPSSLQQGNLSGKEGIRIAEVHYRLPKKKAVWVDPASGEKMDTLAEEYEAERKALAEANAAAQKAYQQDLASWVETMQVAPEAAGPEPQAPQPGPELSDEDAYFYNGHCYYRAYVAGQDAKKGALLEEEQIPLDEFLVKCVTGFPWKKRTERRVRFYGMMRKIYDIQITISRTIQGYLDQMARKAKGGGFIEKSAFDAVPGGYDKFIKNSSTPGMYHLVADGALAAGKVQLSPPIQDEVGLKEAYQTFVEMISLVSGVTRALQGTETRDRSNVLISNLQEQGLQMLLPIRRPRTRFLMDSGRLFAKLCTAFLPPEEIDKILGVQKVPGMTVEMVPDPMTGQETEQPIVGADGEPVTAGKILKKSSLLDYDVAVDVGVATPTQRQATWQFFSQHGLLQTMLEAGMPPEIILPTLLRNSPLPGTVSKDLGDRLEAFYEKQEAAKTTEGMVQMFGELAQSDPEAAQQVMQQLSQMMGGAMPPPGQEAPPQGLPA